MVYHHKIDIYIFNKEYIYIFSTGIYIHKFEFSNYRMRKYIQQITPLLIDSQKLIPQN